jgi:hypothetical protein
MVSVISSTKVKRKNTQLDPIKPNHTPSASKGQVATGISDDLNFANPNFRRTEQSF